jgi:hypothetical protein
MQESLYVVLFLRQVSLCHLEKAEFVLLEPQSIEYLEIGDTRSVFEAFLRQNYSTLSVGSIVSVPHQKPRGDVVFHPFLVKSLKPADRCVITNTDIEVDIVAKDLDAGMEAILHRKMETSDDIRPREIGWKGKDGEYVNENFTVVENGNVYFKVSFYFYPFFRFASIERRRMN